jgi:hypothetical protein
MKNLFSKLSLMAVLLVVFFTSCQKEDVSAVIEGDRPSSARKANININLAFYSIVYSDHPNLTVSQYVLKARKNGKIGVFGFGNTLISAISNWNSSSHTAIQNSNRNDLVSDLNNIANIPKYFRFSDGIDYVIYRNWKYTASKPTPFIIRNPADMTFSSTSPFYYQTGFISCNLDPQSAISFGDPQKILSMPSTLKFTQEWNSSNPGHIGIKPVNSSITQSNLQVQMDLITYEAAQ